jgi:nucleoside-diphosphate kinase
VEKTLVLVKPDGVHRHLTGLVMNDLLSAGLSVVWLSFSQMTIVSAAAFYREHADKPFYDALVTHMADPRGVVAMYVTGDDAVERARKVIENVRADYATDVRNNVVHASRTADAAKAELSIMFGAQDE